MSLHYLTHKKRKEKSVEDLQSLHCEHHPTQPQKKTHRNGSNATIKGYRMILEKVTCIVRTTTRKTDQTKYNKISI